jgi:ubiquinone biosynthesis protein
VVELIQQVIKRDSEAIARCVALLTLAQDVGGLEPVGFKQLITTLTASPEYDALPPVKRAFWLLDELPRHGMVFSSDLMLFRKALFTLEGVLTDLDPGYEMDTYMARYLGGLFTQEWPERVGRLFFPFDDEPGRYPSLMSNGDLQLMLLHQILNFLGDTTDTMVQWVDAQSDIMPGWFGGSDRIRH